MKKEKNIKKPIKINKKKRDFINAMMMVVSCAITICLLLTNSAVVSTDPIRVGAVSSKKYVAEKTIVNEAATEKLRQEAASSVGPLYEHDEDVVTAAAEKIREYFLLVDAELEKVNSQAENVENEENTENNGDDISKYRMNTVLNIPVAVTAAQYKAYDSLTDEGKEVFASDVVDAANAAFDQGITEDTLKKAYEISDSFVDELSWGTELKAMAKSVARAVIEPNLVLDEEAVEAAKQKKMNEVEPVMILKDQKIVDEGEIITQEDYDILSALGYTETKISGNLLLFAVNASIIVLTFIAFYLYMINTQHKLLEYGNSLVVLFFIYILEIVLLAITANLQDYHVVPVSLFAMLAAMLLKPKTAVSLNIFMCVVATVMFRGGVDFMLYSLITGTFAAVLIQYTNKRSKLFFVSLSVGLVNIAAYMLSQAFLVKSIDASIFNDALMAGLTGVIIVIVAVGSLPIWENIFGINTKYRLAELTNPNNELMRRLMIETPGTYHHSLVVANLAETAAYDIYADEALARAGAYYHDIGKLVNPIYFSENQIDKNAHDGLDPYISAKMIIEHVQNGIALAEQYKLPEVIKDIIRQHQGTTLVKYFYMKSAKEKTGEVTHESDFRYPGPIPQSKEAAIVMLADTVEAAVRSFASKGKTMDELKELIDSLVQDKLDDGQLNDCRLDLKEIETIKNSFLKMFKGMYHERVAYPKAEEIKAAIKAEKEREEGCEK